MRYRHDKKKIFYCVVTVIALVILLHPCRHAASNYNYLSRDSDTILDNLYAELAANFTSSATDYCNYENIINDNSTLSISIEDGDLIEAHGIREGGEYAPQECVPSFSTAIIVPYLDRMEERILHYRGRAEQLRRFLVYMHTFFRRQKIHYRIYVIEQVDTQIFNRAKLLNIGAVAAMKAGYPCLVLHNVDLLPLRPANIYACTKLPRHMSANIDSNRFLLPYSDYIGGVMSITSKQYKTVNGMSNGFFAGGGEDSDFNERLKEHNLQVCRFDPPKNIYHHMFHYRLPYQSYGNGAKRKPLPTNLKEDGLNTLHYTEVGTVLHPLFTHIMVDW